MRQTILRPNYTILFEYVRYNYSASNVLHLSQSDALSLELFDQRIC